MLFEVNVLVIYAGIWSYQLNLWHNIFAKQIFFFFNFHYISWGECHHVVNITLYRNKLLYEVEKLEYLFKGSMVSFCLSSDGSVEFGRRANIVTCLSLLKSVSNWCTWMTRIFDVIAAVLIYTIQSFTVNLAPL